MPSIYNIIGLMSGTSLDGVDAALLRTNGHDEIEALDFIEQPYPDDLRDKLRACLGQSDPSLGFVQDAALQMSEFQAQLVRQLQERNGTRRIDAVGFHGQTIFHDPENGKTLQIGDATLMAERTGLETIYDFRSADVADGGQGAPLLPLYHRAIAQKEHLTLPVTFLNIGGVSNITQINGLEDNALYACDTGPGNALIDDFLLKTKSMKYDTAGIIAKSGMADEALIAKWLSLPYFQCPAPKSLDRDAWDSSGIEKLSFENAVATLSAFTVRSIAHHIERTTAVYVCGGGRHNEYIMAELGRALECKVHKIEALGYNGDAIEAQGFAYLAARVLQGLPTSLPSTTGVNKPCCGGKREAPPELRAETA
jgi:anhydro-N-acetylmuramic acid kinase